MAPTVERITGISQDVLKHQVSLDKVSVAKRMSWASKRHTTKLEDEAYSLLGIFNIHMHLSYGEGRSAFRRLQEEISRRIPDQSLFAWGNAAGIGPVHANLLLPHASSRILNMLPMARAEEDRPPLLSAFQSAHPQMSSLFASSPHDFHSSGHVNSLVDHDVFVSLLNGLNVPVQDYTQSPRGMRTQFPLLDLRNTSIDRPEDHSWYIAILACMDEQCGDLRLLGRLCVSSTFSDHTTKVHVLHSAALQINSAGKCGLFVLPTPWELVDNAISRHIHVRTVFLPHLDREAPSLDELELTPPRDPADGKGPEVLYTKWAKDTLRAQGYCVTVHPRTKRDHNIRITLTKGPHAIRVECQYAATTGPRGLRFTADIYCLHEPTPDVEQLRRGFVSATLSGAPTPSDIPYRTVTLFAGYDQRSYSETVSLPWASGGEAVLRLALEPVSAACHHLRIALDEAPPTRLEELDWETGTLEELEGGENRVVLPAGGSGV